MASMKLKEHLEEQLKEEKAIIENCQEPSEYVDTNEAILAITAEGMDKESTNLLSSHRYRKLPAEMNREIFYSLQLATRRKFIWGLGWGFYAMFRQILLKKSKRLRNPQGNAYGQVTFSEDGLIASNNTDGWPHIYAEKGFPISCRMDDFPGTICYYNEVKISKTELWFAMGLTDGPIPYREGIGWSPNSYAMAIRIPIRNLYRFHLSGRSHDFQFPEGVIRPEVKETGNVVGCGILMNPDDKLTIFFTVNGILIDRQFPIDPTVDHLFPTVSLLNDISLEANFGDNPAMPFEYDIKKCPGMGLEWI